MSNSWIVVGCALLVIAGMFFLAYAAAQTFLRSVPSSEGPPRFCRRCGYWHAVRERSSGRLDCGACLFPWNPGEPVHPSALSDERPLDIPVTVDPPTIPDVLRPDPFVSEDKCPHCKAPQAVGHVSSRCWFCSGDLSPVVDAEPTPTEPSGGRAA